MKRILLTKNQPFTATSDNNMLYFCASTAIENGGDYIFGVLDTTFNFNNVYRYGSPGSEVLGDCTLTSDNEYLIGLFSSNYYKPRTGSKIGEGTVTISATSAHQDPYKQPCTAATDPSPVATDAVWGKNNLVWCELHTYSSILGGTSGGINYQNVTPNCSESIFQSFTNYVTNYQNVYSWTTCDFYYYNLDAITCKLILDVSFRNCD